MKEPCRKKRCIVVCAGERTAVELHRSEGDLVIAADGGFSYCRDLGVEPDLVIGDFDSLERGEEQALLHMESERKDSVIRLNPQKDDTDTLAALRLGLKRGYRHFEIYGGTGGRLEHTLANIQSLLFLKRQGAAGYLCGRDFLIFVLKDEQVCLAPEMRGYLSLFSLGEEARGVTIGGMKYPLDGYTMRNDFPIGVSNEFVGQEGRVGVEKGELLGIIQCEGNPVFPYTADPLRS